MGIRVCVTGGRDFNDAQRVYSELEAIHKEHTITELIHGDARGADRLAKDWAIAAGVEQTPFPVTQEEWDRLGKKAGPLRNKRMIATKPDVLVAFPGGRGTANCVDCAIWGGVTVRFA